MIRLIQMRGDKLININPTSGKTLYEQIVDSFKSNFAKGYLKPGDEIPSVRKLAMELSVTPNTVAKAYQELERNGYIYTIKGKGSFVCDSVDAADSKRKELKEDLKGYVQRAFGLGISEQELTALLTESIAEVKGGGKV